MSKTITISDETYDSLKSQIEEKEGKLKEKKNINITIKNRFTGDVVYESEKTTCKEAVEEAIKNGTYLSGAELSGADLSGANLRGANLRGADLSGANLSRANLRMANLSWANLSGADLMNCKFLGKSENPLTLAKEQVPDFLLALGFIIQD